jgi:diguanylate cyclase (GGDEF)-like protein
VRIIVTDGVVTDFSAPTMDPESVAGRPLDHLVHPADEGALKALLTGVSSDHPDRGSIHTIRIGAPDGAISHLELSTEARDGRRVVMVGWDVTAHARRRQALEQLALHDPMTGLANRVLFGERLHDELRRRRRTSADLAMLYADLDGFKAVNDTWGHRAGDLLLAALSARLRAALRPGDILARLGGDEFGVCCPDINGSDAAIAVANRLVEEATRPVNLGGAIVRVSISVGVAMADDDDINDFGGRLLARADLAMYAAKHSGRERIKLAPPVA